MTLQEEYERRGWHFQDTGTNIVGWKNAILKDNRPGCVELTSKSIVIRGQPCTDTQKLGQIIWTDASVEQVYYLEQNQTDPDFIIKYLYEALESQSADDIGEDLDGILRHRLVR